MHNTIPWVPEFCLFKRGRNRQHRCPVWLISLKSTGMAISRICVWWCSGGTERSQTKYQLSQPSEDWGRTVNSDDCYSYLLILVLCAWMPVAAIHFLHPSKSNLLCSNIFQDCQILTGLLQCTVSLVSYSLDVFVLLGSRLFFLDVADKC